MTKSFSSTQPQTHEQTWIAQALWKVVLGSETGDHFQRWCSWEALKSLKGPESEMGSEKEEQQLCGCDGKVGRHSLKWPVQVLQLLNVHTLSCLGDSVAFSGLTLDLKLWMYDRNILFCFCHSASLWVSWDVVTSGDYSRVLHAEHVLWTPFSASSTCYYLNNQTVILVFTTERSVGLLSELTLERWQIYHRPTWETVLFWTGLLSVFFPCKIMFLERLKKFQDLLGAHSKNLCLVIYQLAGGLTVPVLTSLFYLVSPCLSKAKGFYFAFKF